MMIQNDLSSRRVALYARTATDVRTPNSVETQLATCRTYAQRQGWHIEMEHFDKDLSGQDTARPGFQALCTAIESGRLDIVLFVSFDRQGIAQQCPRGDQQMQRPLVAAVGDVDGQGLLAAAQRAEVGHCPVHPDQA